jgi:2'-5' RNA ligase
LPENIQDKLVNLKNKWLDLPCRWVKSENLHITLIPPMYLDDNQINILVNALLGGLRESKRFSLDFSRIIYGPPGKYPRMIWLEGKSNDKLIELKKKVEDLIFKADIPFRKDSRPMRPHITLCRMVEEKWRGYNPKPKIDEKFELSVAVDSIKVMESVLGRGGAEYIILENIPLKAD